jgi:hypothetical protein
LESVPARVSPFGKEGDATILLIGRIVINEGLDPNVVLIFSF